MKIQNFIFTITFLLAYVANGFSQEVVVTQHRFPITQGDSLYRIQTVEVQTSPRLSDTLTVSLEPKQWLDSSQYIQYTEQLVQQAIQRREDLRKLFIEQNQQVQVLIQLHEQLAGAGSFLVKQKEQVANLLQGEWKYFRRVGDKIIEENVAATVDGMNITVKGKTGTIMINDDLTFTVSGLIAGNITFSIVNNQFLRADVGNQIIVLRK